MAVSCVMWNEAYKTAKKDLFGKQALGEDITDALAELEDLNTKMTNGERDKVINHIKQSQKDLVFLDNSQIAEINKNNPRTTKNVKVKVISAWDEPSRGRYYKVQYPNGTKEYIVHHTAIGLDQISPNGIFGSNPKSKEGIDKNFDDIRKNIWNDQKAALELFDELVKIDGKADAHTEELKKLLKRITDPQAKILNEFKVYINKQAKDNNGTAVLYKGNPYIKLELSNNPDTQNMTAAETYVHEMLHMSIEIAKREKSGKVANTINRLHSLYEYASKKVQPSDLESEKVDAVEAQSRWDYMFNNNKGTGFSEFIAYSMTNNELKQKLKTIFPKEEKYKFGKDYSLWDNIASGIIYLYDALRDFANGIFGKEVNSSSDAYVTVAGLVEKLWEHNNRTVDKNRLSAKIADQIESYTSKIDDKIRSTAVGTAKVLSDGLKFVENAFPEEDSTIRKSANFIRNTGRFLNPYKTEKEQVASAQVLREFEKNWGDLFPTLGGLFAAEGTIRNTLGYLTEDDSYIKKIELLGLLNQKVDARREKLIAAVGGNLLAKMKNISKKEQIAATEAWLATDTKALYGDMPVQEIMELFDEDTSKADEVIKNLYDKLSALVNDVGIENYYKGQAKGLAKYMNTGISSSALNLNAEDIVMMLGTDHHKNIIKNKSMMENRNEIASIVDKLTTVEAIKSLNAKAKANAKNINQKYPEALEALLITHTRQELDERQYQESKYIKSRRTKGELKELKAGWKEYTIAPNDDVSVDKMKKKGWILAGDSNVKNMGVYIQNVAGLSKFEKQAVAKINEKKEYHNLESIGRMLASTEAELDHAAVTIVKNISNGKKAAKTAVEDMMKTGEAPIADGLIPIRDVAGNIINFGASISKELLNDAVGIDMRAPVLLGKMVAETQEKKDARMQNMMVWETIIKDQEKNYTRDKDGEFGINGREYIEIGPDAKVVGKVAKTYSDEKWRDLPDNIKQLIKNKKKGQQYIAVRRDMAEMLFGGRSPSVLNAKVPFTKDKTWETVLRNSNLNWTVDTLKVAGDIWTEMVSMIKVSIVIKTPKVIIDNMLSNIAYSMYLGQWPWEVAKGQLDMAKATKKYMDDEKEYLRLDVALKSKTIQKDDINRMQVLKSALDNNPVAPLMKAGLFTAVIEDVSMKDLYTETRLSQTTDKIGEYIPEIIKDVAGTLYMTEDSSIYRAMLMGVQYGDFIARANRYHFLVQKGIPANNALKMVLDEFVNYNRIKSKPLRWLNEMGFAQFLAYFFGANKSLIAKAKDKPTAMASMSFMMGGPNPSDALPWEKDMTFNIHSPTDLLLDQTTSHLLPPSTLEMFGLFR